MAVGWRAVRSFLSRVLRKADLRHSPLSDAPEAVVDGAELVARLGYGARGLVYLSVGALSLMAVLSPSVEATSPSGALGWLSQQPLGRLWLFFTALGLAAFAGWRLLQCVFDADRQGRSWRALSTRASQGFSAMGYGVLAWSALSLLVRAPADPAAAEVERSHHQAEQMLALPHGHLMLAGVAVALAGVGLANISRAWREDFTAYLRCSQSLCRRVAPLARAGYIARGFAYLPLAALVMIAAIRSRPSDVTSLGGALDAMADQPIGGAVLVVAALGFMAFGAFSFVEARFRKIRLAQ